MDSQANNFYETASQPDTGNDDAYTFLEFNRQGEDDFNYTEFQDLSQPNAVRYSFSSSVWPAPPDSISIDTSAVVDHRSDSNPSPGSATSGKGSGGRGNNNASQASAVDALAAGMSGLNFEETRDDESYEYGKGDLGSMLVGTAECRIRLVS